MSNLSLVEKYRPKNINDVLDQSNITSALQKTIKDKNIPHLLFYGSPGVGKTSIALSLAKTLYNNKNYSDRILELNASDERGIQIVREKIKNFAKFSVNNDKCAPFKIIILDEADSMTSETQLALRYIIEQYSLHTRFIIICNYINKIIEPIISRCALFRFKPIRKNVIFDLLKKISEKENIKITNDKMKDIFYITNGDLRYSINLLEQFKFNDKINLNIISNTVVKELYNNIINNDKLKLLKLIKDILNDGHSANEILINILPIIIDDDNLDEMKKCDILYEISVIDNNLNNGSNDFIQILYLTQIIFNI